MAGIVEQEMEQEAPEAAPQKQAAPTEQAGPQDAGKRDLSPETLRIVIAAKRLLSQPTVLKSILDIMKKSGQPALALANATVFLMKELLKSAKGAPPRAVVEAAQEVMVDIAKIGANAGLFKVTPEIIKNAVLLAVRLSMEAAKAKRAQPPAQPAPQQPRQQPAAAPAAPAAQPMGV